MPKAHSANATPIKSLSTASIVLARCESLRERKLGGRKALSANINHRLSEKSLRRVIRTRKILCKSGILCKRLIRKIALLISPRKTQPITRRLRNLCASPGRLNHPGNIARLLRTIKLHTRQRQLHACAMAPSRKLLHIASHKRARLFNLAHRMSAHGKKICCVIRGAISAEARRIGELAREVIAPSGIRANIAYLGIGGIKLQIAAEKNRRLAIALLGIAAPGGIEKREAGEFLLPGIMNVDKFADSLAPHIRR